MPGLREALEDSYDTIDGDVSGEEVAALPGDGADALGEQSAPDAVEVESAAEGDRPRDESGRFVKEPAQEKPASSPAGLVAGQGAGTGAAAPVAAPVSAPAFKPPQSWRAPVRELAGKLPAEFHPILEEALRRDKEAAQALQQRAEALKGAETWTHAIRPYEAQIRAAGATPEQYVGNLLQTAHGLFYGPAHLKPSMLADLIMQTGVPPEQLDQALVARMNGQPVQQPQQRPQEFRDPRLDQFFAQQQQKAAASAEQDAGSFADTHEFFADVAEDLANILDVWAKQGKEEVSEQDMERAYQLACGMNNDVSTTLEQRKQHAAVATTQVATQRARNAASSVRNQPTAAIAAQPNGRRPALEAAYDELDR